VSLRIGYVTNGLGQHRLDDALALLADNGYDGVALTLDHLHLDPFARDLPARVSALAARLEELGLAVVLETGARFLLDPRRKHEPTLVSNLGRERRLDLYRRALAIAAELRAEAVSIWSGTVPAGTSRAEAWGRLVEGMFAVVEEAEAKEITVGFEPEPGMLVDRLESVEALVTTLGRPERLGVTLDLGHCVCLEPEPVADCVRRAAPRLVHVHVEDMRRGVHEHLDFGEGELDLPVALAALEEVRYRGLVAVELSRHSHAADTVVPRAIRVLREAERLEVLVP
jgi:sugar phosphate isomerase/epimerase